MLALGLRLLVWRWHRLYALGGDEQEYFNQALTLLRNHSYADLNLMRPPLYTGFLAGCIVLLDSLVQRIRLVQAVVSALTVVPIFLLTRAILETGDRRRETADRRPQTGDRRPEQQTTDYTDAVPASQLTARNSQLKTPLVAAGLWALSYTLAANATELLTETLFVFGLATWLWLMIAARGRALWLAAAGLALGGLILLRSVALPLLPLGALWLLACYSTNTGAAAHEASKPAPALGAAARLLAFLMAATLVVAPWTARNYLAYGALIVVDTTGAENLWLDNNPAGATPTDPLGREAAKRALYALGDDRAARQQLATRNGSAAILANPGWFAQKAWGEAKKFFALQYFDDMRARRAIWLPPAEVGLALLLGDGMWLVLLLAGAAGLWLAPCTMYDFRFPIGGVAVVNRTSHIGHWHDPRWLLVPWALYTLLTALLFHVELRYRLPLYPALAPYAAWSLTRLGSWAKERVATKAQRHQGQPEAASARAHRQASRNLGGFAWLWLRSRWRGALALLTCLALLGMTLAHRAYIGESATLARKHLLLAGAERALAAGDMAGADEAAQAALALDPDSALARVALARAALLAGDQSGALAASEAAIGALRAQPYAHLLRGAILRERGDEAAAQEEFSFEQASREDLQAWSWAAFAPLASLPNRVAVGRDDLGFVQGFWLPEDTSRWTTAHAQAQLSAPGAGGTRLVLDLSAGRPAGAPPALLLVLVNGRELARLQPSNDWASYSVDIPAELLNAERRALVELRTNTFRPRDYDRASPDDRDLGVRVRSIELKPR